MFKIYGTPACVWCTRAKRLLEVYEYEYEYIGVTEDEEAKQMFVKNNFKTVPQIFKKGEHIGGYDSLFKLLNQPI